MALGLHLAEHPEAKILGKKVLILGSCAALGSEGGVPCGFMSSIVVRELLLVLRRIVLPGTRVDHLPRWEDKIEAIFEMLRGEDLAILAAMPPWMAAFLRYCHQRTGKKALERWPSLSLLIHSGVAMDSYRTEIESLVGRRADGTMPSFRNGFGATEGNIALQDGDAGMALLTESIFFEFVPLDAYLEGRAEAARVPLAEVRSGVDYVLVMTTPGGLWAYVIGDTVRFESLTPYRLGITGRTAQFLNLAGEKISVDQALKAAAEACRATGALLDEFTLFPRDAGGGAGFVPGHEWVTEFAREPESAERFLEALDEALARLNPLYRVRRASQFGSNELLARRSSPASSAGPIASGRPPRAAKAGISRFPGFRPTLNSDNHSSKTGARMNLTAAHGPKFSEQLEEELVPLWGKLMQTRIYRALLSDESLGLELLQIYLLESYHYVKHNAQHQALAVWQKDVRDREFMRRAIGHAYEEVDHDQLALNDLKGMGLAKGDVERSIPLPETLGFTGFLYYGCCARIPSAAWAIPLGGGHARDRADRDQQTAGEVRRLRDPGSQADLVFRRARDAGHEARDGVQGEHRSLRAHGRGSRGDPHGGAYLAQALYRRA